MLTLKLFNSVEAKESKTTVPFISKEGFIIEPGAIWAKDQIIEYYRKEKLTGNDLNKTFHKSWVKIINSSRFELLLEQITHYISTYGSNFGDEIYIPNEILEVPDVELRYKVIKALSKEELITKGLDLLRSGIALKEETITDVLSLLHDTLDYSFTGDEGIRNKEAIAQIADLYGVYPSNPVEFLRFIVYKTNGSTLLIKDKNTLKSIEESKYNPSVLFKNFGLEKLATIFNRFKPIFLAYKKVCPKTINKISKLSKEYHIPLKENPLNFVTQRKLITTKGLENVTIFALLKALSVCHNRMVGQESFNYRIRNGKSFVKEQEYSKEQKTKIFDICSYNYDFIINYLKNKIDLKDKTFYIPKDVEYAIPTSEKMFVGNIPTGTKFYGDKLAVGIYWENGWGAYDLDLSGITVDGKVGWNASYNSYDELLYSGDITNAPKGAVEYLYAKNLRNPVLVQNNVFNGSDTCDYKIVVGKGDNIDYNYMMNPNKLFLEEKCKSVQKQTILGIIIPENKTQSFVILNFGAGCLRVSGNVKNTKIAREALLQQWSNPLSLEKLLTKLGAKITSNNTSKVDYDLDLDKLEKDTFTKILKF